MGDANIYIQQLDLWPEIIPKSHILQLLKAFRAKSKYASTYFRMDGGKWIPGSHKWNGSFHEAQVQEIIIHGLFLDDMMHIPTMILSSVSWQKCQRLWNHWWLSYETFQGMQIEQLVGKISFHLDHCIHNVIYKYKKSAALSLQIWWIPCQTNVMDAMSSPVAQQLSNHTKQQEADILLLYTCEAAICCYVDLLWYFSHCSTSCPVLCVSRTIALQDLAYADGIPQRVSKLQVNLSEAHLDNHRSACFFRIRLGQ